MNKIVEINYPSLYNSKYVQCLRKCNKDLQEILEKSGEKNIFWAKYTQRLKYLEKEKENCIFHPDWFESLNEMDLYSMRFNKTKSNIRIIFTFVNIKGKKYALLLYAFTEKASSNSKKKSYREAIPIAYNRLKEVMTDD